MQFLFIGFWEVSLVLLVAVVVFGPKKIPEIARGLAQGVRTMREATDEIKREIMETTDQVDPTKEIREETRQLQNQIQETSKEIQDGLGSIKREF